MSCIANKVPGFYYLRLASPNSIIAGSPILCVPASSFESNISDPQSDPEVGGAHLSPPNSVKVELLSSRGGCSLSNTMTPDKVAEAIDNHPMPLPMMLRELHTLCMGTAEPSNVHAQYVVNVVSRGRLHRDRVSDTDREDIGINVNRRHHFHNPFHPCIASDFSYDRRQRTALLRLVLTEQEDGTNDGNMTVPS